MKWCGREEETFYRKVDKNGPGGCWLWNGFLNHDGYGRVGPRKGVRSGGRAHKVAWEMLNGPVPSGLSVMHTCDVRACVNPAHLKVGTHQENVKDMLEKGRNAKGERYPGTKLTASKVIEIRALEGTATQRVIAERYGVSQAAIAAIFSRHSWRHI